MVKQLNVYGKLLHIFTAFFPLYSYWTYFSFTKIGSFNVENLFQKEAISFFILCILTIFSIVVFYFVLLKKRKNPDKELNIKKSEKNSGYLKYTIGSLSPFILFLVEFINNPQLSKASIIIGTAFFIIMGVILVFKEETGILYNLFYLPYHTLSVTTKEGKTYVVVTTKEKLSGYIKVNQLDGKIFREWN